MKRFSLLPQNKLKFLVDESTGQKVVEALRLEGYDVFSVNEHFPGINDVEILQFAFNQGRIIVTNDKDFGELIYHRKIPSKGVILLRLRDESPQNKIRIVLYVLKKFNNKLLGNFVVAIEHSIRIRPL